MMGADVSRYLALVPSIPRDKRVFNLKLHGFSSACLRIQQAAGGMNGQQEILCGVAPLNADKIAR